MSRYELYAPRYPLLPLKNVVIFPRNIVTLLVGRPRSIQAVEDSLARDRRIVVTAHRDSEIEEPRPEDLYTIGALADGRESSEDGSFRSRSRVRRLCEIRGQRVL